MAASPPGPHHEPDSAAAKLTGAYDFGLDVIAKRAPTAWVLHAIRATVAPAWISGFQVGERAIAAGARLITAADIAGAPLIGPALQDEPVFPDGMTGHVGQIVALLAAPASGPPCSAEDVRVEYRALASCDVGPSAPEEYFFERGDVSAALERAAYVADGTYLFPSQRHYHLDVDAGMADFDGRRLHVVAPTQAPYELRSVLSAVTSLPESDITVEPVNLGAAFGSRLENLFPCQLAVAAMTLGASVSCTIWQRDRVRFGVRGHALAMRLRTAVGPSGELLATIADFSLDQGAVTSYSPVVMSRLITHLGLTYNTGAVQARGRLVPSYLPSAAAFRGFGVPQLAIAIEHQMDVLADKFGVDPFEFRIRNAQPRLVAPLRRSAELLRAAGPDDANSTTGVGSFAFGVGNTGRSNPASVIVTYRGDGAFEVWAAVMDYGQGAHRALRRMLQDALGAPDADVRVRTDIGPPGANAGKTSASRTVHFVGSAIAVAVANLRRSAADALALPATTDEALLPLLARLDVEQPSRMPLVAHGEYDPHRDLGVDPYPIYSYGCYAVKLDRDASTGGVRVTQVVAVHDVGGPPIDPDVAIGQVHGGVAMGAGYALFEPPDASATLAPRLPITSAPDLPAPIVEFVHTDGPRPAAERAGLGEPAGMGMPAAVHSALWRSGRDVPAGMSPYPGDSFVQEFCLHTTPAPVDARVVVLLGYPGAGTHIAASALDRRGWTMVEVGAPDGHDVDDRIADAFGFLDAAAIAQRVQEAAARTALPVALLGIRTAGQLAYLQVRFEVQAVWIETADDVRRSRLGVDAGALASADASEARWGLSLLRTMAANVIDEDDATRPFESAVEAAVDAGRWSATPR